MPLAPPNAKPAILLYDEQCPLCSSYVHYYRLKNAAGDVTLIDARQPSALKDRVSALGWNLDEGMVLCLGDAMYFGSDAIRMMALMSTRSGWFNRLNYRLFRSRFMAKLLYPLCRLGRTLALRMRGIPAIGNLDEAKRGHNG